MPPPQHPSNRVARGRRILAALSRVLPVAARFRLLGLPAGEIHGDPTGRSPGYRAEPGPVGAIHHLPNGFAWGRGAHLDADHRLIHLLSPAIGLRMDYWMLKRQRVLPKIIRLSPETVSLIADGDENYYHWMFDVLPRLAALGRASLPRRHYLVSQDHPFHRQTLDLLNIPSHARTAAGSLQFYTAARLLIPLVRTGVTPENVRFVRGLLFERAGLADTPPAGERIYISRSRAASRRVLNEEEFYPLLKQHGFRIYHLEELSLREQMLLFHGAEVILAAHGAAWTNLIFARPGTIALEIVPEGLEGTHAFAYRLYKQLAALTGVRHELIMAPTSDRDYPHGGNLRLEPQALHRVLAGLG